MSAVRKIIGFIPALLPMFMAWFFMSPMPATSEIYRTPLYRPDDVPWFIWLWIALSVGSGILLCIRKLLPFGLAAGIIPYIMLFYIFLTTEWFQGWTEAYIFFGAMIFFYILYAIIYYTYHREADKP